MLIGVPRESAKGERRVAASPKSVAQLVKLGYGVAVEEGAGAAASFPDSQYVEAGADVVSRQAAWGADVVTKIDAPTDAEIKLLRKGAVLVSLVAAPRSPELLKKLSKAGVTVLAMDSVPRISRAQALDVISSMANIAGYRAVIEAANVFGSFFTGQVTAAGKVPPAKVFVSGAGVAGLAAIGAARALGAIVRATDIRAAVAEQVESMGADFVGVEAESQESADGYAKEASEDYAAAAARMYAEQVKDVDIVVTTAQIPGKTAPRLLTEEMVASMRPGSVVVDMAAGTGGNVAGSKPDQLVVTAGGVTIIGYTDLAGRMPTQASNLFAQNIVNFLKLATPGKDGELVLDQEDVVVRGMTVVLDGEVTWPPPPVSVSAAPAAPPPEPAGAGGGETASGKKKRDPRVTWTVLGVCAAALLALFWVSPAGLLGHFMVFMLAVVVGYYVIGNVSHSLHTPLMSVTNAISGIIVVGSLAGLTQSQHEGRTDIAILVLSVAGILLASINVFGGFTVTQRMLKMFQKG
ncbi:MAG: Re/Si-specific NAD(P)(+) transhydrogenase subunit alpha [Bifidobacteriaceae bacterium]|jgi:NAD(P) transhydrogenase subunit alpha|nr:Re/Si-specific NAD(P)(+) transhydrogenase subunit alpha [Bifidobacteriaceae bacterium]